MTKVYVIIDKKTDKIMSYDNGKELVFAKKKKDVLFEYESEIKQAILKIEVQSIDY